ncbi:hypothetical protein D3C78_1495510 [compost metagenome]
MANHLVFHSGHLTAKQRNSSYAFNQDGPTIREEVAFDSVNSYASISARPDRPYMATSPEFAGLRPPVTALEHGPQGTRAHKPFNHFVLSR